MSNLFKKLSNQNLTKLCFMAYNVIRVSGLKLIYGSKINLKLMQNLHPTTEVALKKGYLEMSKSVFTRKYVSFRVESGYLKIGTSFFNQGCTVTSMSKIIIGNDCLFGPNVVIVDHDHDYSFKDSKRGSNYLKDEIFIGDNVWIGANCTILRGSYLDDNCVVAANTVVKGKFKKGTLIREEKNTIQSEIKLKGN